MANVKEKVKLLCKAHGITVEKLEKELKFGHGTIGRWNKYNPQTSRLTAVAAYFNVPVESLISDENEIPATDGDGELEDALSRGRAEACFNIMRTLSPENQQFALDFLKKLASSQ